MPVTVYLCEWLPIHPGYPNSLVNAKRYAHVSSVEALPSWMQERYAVLRLLEEGEQTPLGMRSRFSLFIVPQPGDPKWEK